MWKGVANILRECDGLLSEVWINTVQHSEECWTVLIHTSDKRPSHSHCYQVNDCQITIFKNQTKKMSNCSNHVLLIKGGTYVFLVQKTWQSFTRLQWECDGLLSEVWINTVQHSEELICNIFRRPKGKEGIAIQFRGMLDSINPYLG